jgi:hypothetical protein
MPHLAHLTVVTGGSRVYGNALAQNEWVIQSIAGVFPNCFDDSSKLVAEHQRGLHPGVADAPVGVGMQVRAADADGCYFEEDLARARRIRAGDVVNANVTRAVESGCEHG